MRFTFDPRSSAFISLLFFYPFSNIPDFKTYFELIISPKKRQNRALIIDNGPSLANSFVKANGIGAPACRVGR